MLEKYHSYQWIVENQTVAPTVQKQRIIRPDTGRLEDFWLCSMIFHGTFPPDTWIDFVEYLPGWNAGGSVAVRLDHLWIDPNKEFNGTNGRINIGDNGGFWLRKTSQDPADPNRFSFVAKFDTPVYYKDMALDANNNNATISMVFDYIEINGLQKLPTTVLV